MTARSSQKEALTWEQLSALPLLMLEQGSSIRRYVDRFAESQGAKLLPEIELGSIELLIQFARIGLGTACVIREFIEDELANGSLTELCLAEPLPPRRVGLATLRDVPLSTAAARFLETLP